MILLMHKTTLEFLKNYLDAHDLRVEISQYEVKFNGVEVRTCDWLKPTINEPKEWIFPKNRFITYEKSDEDWCIPLKFGRMGHGFELGEIFKINPQDFYPMYCKYNLNPRPIRKLERRNNENLAHKRYSRLS
jgi:hypothetical protein